MLDVVISTFHAVRRLQPDATRTMKLLRARVVRLCRRSPRVARALASRAAPALLYPLLDAERQCLLVALDGRTAMANVGGKKALHCRRAGASRVCGREGAGDDFPSHDLLVGDAIVPGGEGKSSEHPKREGPDGDVFLIWQQAGSFLKPTCVSKFAPGPSAAPPFAFDAINRRGFLWRLRS